MQNRLNSAYQSILFFLRKRKIERQRERERKREKKREEETILFTSFNSLITKLDTFLTREFICEFVRCLQV